MDEECRFDENTILEEIKKVLRKLDEIEKKVDAVAHELQQNKNRGTSLR